MPTKKTAATRTSKTSPKAAAGKVRDLKPLPDGKEGLPDALIGKAIRDKRFRNALLRDPRGTLANEGYAAAPELVTAIKALDPAFVEAAVDVLVIGNYKPSPFFI